MLCEEVTPQLAHIVDDGVEASADVRNHVDSCLQCQAEVAHYRKLLRSLHALRTDVLEPAPGLVADVLAKMEEVGERSAIRSMLGSKKTAYAGGMAMATAAGVVGAVIFANRVRRSRKVA